MLPAKWCRLQPGVVPTGVLEPPVGKKPPPDESRTGTNPPRRRSDAFANGEMFERRAECRMNLGRLPLNGATIWN